MTQSKRFEKNRKTREEAEYKLDKTKKLIGMKEKKRAKSDCAKGSPARKLI